MTSERSPRADQAPPSRAGLDPAREVLPNGAVVIVKTTDTTPAVTLNVSVQAGIVCDPPDRRGIAHFVSRTIDRGTVTRSADQIAEELDNAGVSLAVTVNRHAISLVCTCLVEDFGRILSLVGEIVMSPTFPAAQVENRRTQIVTTIRQDEENPAIVAAEGLMALLYGHEHGYGTRPRGTVDSVSAIDAASLQAFHRQRFVPAAASVVIVGDVDARAAIDAAAGVFAPWKAAPVTPVELVAPAPATGRQTRLVSMMNKSQADIAYGFTTITRSDPAYYSYWVMNNILGQYAIGGRLGDSIRERQGMAYYAMSALDANVIPGPLFIRAGVNPANIPRALASIDEELRRMAADGPTDKEMRESVQYLIGSMPRTLETNVQIAAFLQTGQFFGLGLDYDVRVPALLHAVTREDVHAAARQVLDPAKAAVVVAGPYEGPVA
jgi:zinc protease